MRFLLTLTILAYTATVAQAAEHIVEMKNIGADGPMVFEPGVVRAAVGDTVKFVATDAAHNSESVAGLIPDGATAWKGTMNQEITVTLDAEGVYVYQCLPHTIMAMVGVIVAGEPTNLEAIKTNAESLKSQFMASQERLDNYLGQLE